MQPSEFVHLHVHTAYSLLDGAIRIESLLERAKAYGMTQLAITDHGCMYGAIEFYEKARKAGIKPIIGCEMYVAPASRFDKDARQQSELSHLVLLAKDINGYKNLCRLVAAAHLEGFYYKPRVDKALLSEFNQGLIALSGCLHGECARLIQAGRTEKAMEVARAYETMFGQGNFYLELQMNGLEAQGIVNKSLAEIGQTLSIPTVATNDCHYLNKEDARAHDILLCIQTGKTVHETGRFRFQTDQLYFKSPQQMMDDFVEYPEAAAHTADIGAKCHLELDFSTYHFPKFKVPASSTEQLESATVNERQAEDSYLEKLAWEGLQKRFEAIARRKHDFSEEQTGQYRQRLEVELGVIKNMGFSGYFLVVSDFVCYAKRSSIPVGPGRGSAAGSLVAYALQITDLDPIEHGLIFERFLNPARRSMPDIDIDFCIEGRDAVIKYVVENYGGGDQVAQIITFGKLQARAVIRDVGRTLDIPLREVDAIAKLIPEVLNISLKEALAQEPRLGIMALENPQIKDLLNIAQALEGLPRHASTHAAGVVISGDALVNHLPLTRGKKGEVVTQYDMKCVEKIGLVKFDFLGLRNLTVMKHACDMIKRRGAEPPDLELLELTDKKTFELLSSAQTTGVFQLESSGMKDLLVRMKPTCFEDIVALVALYRPGPLDSGMHDAFVERKNGKVPVVYPLPELEPILKDTYGVILYQEQVMNIAVVLADYSMADADNLRKAMGKKIAEIMVAERERFLSGAKKKGVDIEKATSIFDLIEKFGRYGFNKAHSAAYALIAYQTAYLKAHFPVDFIAAILTSEMSHTENVVKYIGECRNQDISVLPPDINESDLTFTVSGGAIRFGLAAVKNVGEGAIESVLEVRKKSGAFKSLFDFCERVDQRKVNRRVIESLIKCGAFDFPGVKRSQMIAVLDQAMDIGQSVKKDRSSGQISLFDFMPGQEVEIKYPPLPDIEEWAEDERLAYEKAAIGFFITGHPLAQYAEMLRKIGDTDTTRLRERSDGAIVRIGGLITECKFHTDRKGARMAFLTLEDLYGFAEVILFSSVYAEVAQLVEKDKAVFIEGRVTKDEKSVKVLVEKLLPIDEAEETWATTVRLSADAAGLDKARLVQLHGILKKHPGNCQAFLHLLTPEGAEAIIGLPETMRLRAGRALNRDVTGFLGSKDAVKTICLRH